MQSTNMGPGDVVASTGHTEFQFDPRVPTTIWHNPTPHVQRVDVFVPATQWRVQEDANGKKTRVRVDTQELVPITWQPGETKALPVDLDRAVHHVICSESSCIGKGACIAPGLHKGAVVQGGGAPLLRRVAQSYGIHPSIVEAPRSTSSASGPRETTVDDKGAKADQAAADEAALARARARRAQ